MKKTAELKVLPVSVLKPAEYNPRKKLKPGDKEYEKIKNSIEEFGFADPLVVNADMTIIGGHQRLTVAMSLGYTEVPCAVVDVDKTREKALNIALNKITGAWDDSLLADLLKDIENSSFDLGFTGFDPPEIERDVRGIIALAAYFEPALAVFADIEAAVGENRFAVAVFADIFAAVKRDLVFRPFVNGDKRSGGAVGILGAAGYRAHQNCRRQHRRGGAPKQPFYTYHMNFPL